jgi:hypothetical protein
MDTLLKMLAQGYRVGAPTQEAEDIDSQVAERQKCPKCDGSMRYEGYHRNNGSYRSYLAFAVCRNCGHTVAF